MRRDWIRRLARVARHRTDRWDDESAISLVEMIIAVFILAVSLIALAGVAGATLASVRGSRDREQAINAATGAIEDVRSRAWEDVVLSPTVAVTGASGDCWEGEPLVRNVSSDPIPHEKTVTGNVRLTVRTYVTWADADCTTGLPKTTKRVVSIVTYQEPDGGTRTVRQETHVAEADRGLPVPEFQLAPSEKTIQFSTEDVSLTRELCGRHQLRNLGSPDTYDWVPTKVSGTTGSPFQSSGSEFKTPDGRYTVRALFESPSANEADVEEAGVVLGLSGTQSMVDNDGNGRPEAPQQVSETGTANIWICYKPDPTKVSDGDTIIVTVNVHSEFNPNRFETVTQTVAVGNPSETWYLYDRDDTQQHARGVTSGGKTVYPTYTMGVPDGLSGSTDNLGTTDYTLASQTDWDSDVDANQYPGVRLIRNHTTTALQSLVWHEQFLAPATLDDQMQLTLWVSTTARLMDPTVSTTGTQYLRVDLERLKKNESTLDATLDTQVVTYSFVSTDTGAWKQLTIPVALDVGDAAFAADQFLRLRVTCLNTVLEPSPDDCHVAYDNTTYSSNLRVVRK